MIQSFAGWLFMHNIVIRIKSFSKHIVNIVASQLQS